MVPTKVSSLVFRPQGRRSVFYTVDAMRVVNGKITEHWGVATLLDLMHQLGVVPPLSQSEAKTPKAV